MRTPRVVPQVRARAPPPAYDAAVLDPGGAISVVLAAYRDDFYDFVLVLHILCAIVGFGAVFLNGVYGQQMKTRLQSGRVAEAIGIYEANSTVSRIGEYFIYAVFVLGFALLGLSDSVIEFSQTWLWLSVVIYVLAIGLSHGVLMPAVKRMGVLMHEMAAGPPPVGGPPPQAAEMASIGQKLGVVGPILDLSMIAVLFLMVYKPGF
jgi:hypothetical protein